ncbi:MAG: LamG-like jellyroll fold domain-containing protein, partial [Marinoscillum sp.]
MKKIILLLTLAVLMLPTLAQDLSSGLLVYYPFTGNADDAGPSGFDGTVVGATLVEGYDGTANSAYDFNGSTNQIVFGDFDLSTESFSISFWVKLPELPVGSTSYRLLSKREACNAGQLIDIAASNSTTYGYAVGMELRQGNFIGSVNTGSVSNPHDWFHVTFTKDNDSDKSYAYVNGTLVSENSWNTSADLNVGNNAPFGIANSPCVNYTSVKRFEGSVDEVRVHNRVLTSQEIESMVPFSLNDSYPVDGATNASVSSGIHLEFTRALDETTVNATNISVTGSVSGALMPTFSGAATKILSLSFTEDLPYNETITVSHSGLMSAEGDALASGSFSFQTIESGDVTLVDYSFNNDYADNSIFSTDAIPVNEPTFGNDRLGTPLNALTFDGSNDYLRIEHADRFNFGAYGDLSIALWFKTNGSVNSQQVFINKFAGDKRLFAGLTSTGQLKLQLTYASGQALTLETTSDYDDGFWYHAAFVVDRDNMAKIYVNGSQVAEMAVVEQRRFDSGAEIRIGSLQDDTQHFDGSLDEFKMYNRTLTEDEVVALAPIYLSTFPMEGEVAARPDTDIKFEFGQIISVATAIPGNFTITGSETGVTTFTLAGGGTRNLTLTPDVEFALDETVTVTYANLEAENGEILDGTLTFETADVNKGMLVHYPFSGNADNAVSSDYHGVVSGATLTNGFDGTAGSAYEFDGNDHITIGQLGLDKESFAIAFWVNRDESTTRGEILGQRQFCTGSDFMEISASYNVNTGKYEVVLVTAKNSGGFQSYSVRAEITPGEWAHIVAERDAKDGVLRMYKNGALVSEAAYSSSYSILNDATMAIGGGNACIGVDGRGRFRGSLDDLRIYRRAIHPDEVAQLTDFMLEASYPTANSEKVSSTSNIYFDF